MPEAVLTIMFRGLMVFHQQGAVLEVGILPNIAGHYLRINTFKNGVLDSVKSLEAAVIGTQPRGWKLQVVTPIGQGARQYTDGTPSPLNRKVDVNEAEDFRWIIDLEDSTDWYGPLGNKVHTSILSPVLYIPNGKFYTRQKSRRVKRKKVTDPTGSETDFGRVCAAVGCDIRLQQNNPAVAVASLVPIPPAGAPAPPALFDFKLDEPNTIFEIAHTPPDYPPVQQDHFHHYYHSGLLDPSLTQYEFPIQAGIPAPSPALCGEVLLGSSNNPL